MTIPGRPSIYLGIMPLPTLFIWILFSLWWSLSCSFLSLFFCDSETWISSTLSSSRSCLFFNTWRCLSKHGDPNGCSLTGYFGSAPFLFRGSPGCIGAGTLKGLSGCCFGFRLLFCYSAPNAIERWPPYSGTYDSCSMSFLTGIWFGATCTCTWLGSWTGWLGYTGAWTWSSPADFLGLPLGLRYSLSPCNICLSSSRFLLSRLI